MLIDNKEWETIWLNKKKDIIEVIDQTKLPHIFEIKEINNYEDAASAIQNMIIRGAPLIGVMGAYGLMLALQENPSMENLKNSYEKLLSTRPTAVNLQWSLKRVFEKVSRTNKDERALIARKEATKIKLEDINMCSLIGDNGLRLIQDLVSRKNEKTINVLTHCNAGWLATVNWGTALSPIYKAHRAGIKIHVWVDETRPRNQGANLTAFELKNEGIPHTVIVDNAGGHLMQQNLVDLVIVGSDRTTKRGDVCNKIGTYLKALAANANNVPFYAALPVSTIDWEIENGLKEINIETRSEKEITHISGLTKNEKIETIRLSPEGSRAFNPGFDVTPNKLVTGLITEKGICNATYDGLKNLYS
ncbi:MULTISPECIES: S-methyl-5-thioribose-1-phosphate isomerase [Prochlorococcus]|uniref:Methylthioribose-1-phosphate isomerase n=1 Tax=Prochlorococcus marinus str. MIT 9314 TaxID=167548 RepID=A0A0A2AFB4_PROMR|nr:S-methyl-5-thioribose-1-phosphate isomerase [Prochlorococcus marinus]KGG00291.1 Methylthioribose-1-phosphate isomerase [Prochlorococcus marinus str. MIT 9314]